MWRRVRRNSQNESLIPHVHRSRHLWGIDVAPGRLHAGCVTSPCSRQFRILRHFPRTLHLNGDAASSSSAPVEGNCYLTSISSAKIEINHLPGTDFGTGRWTLFHYATFPASLNLQA